MKQWISVLLVAATYIGTVIGAGFATGKEIVTFFSKYGEIGTIGVVISCILFILFGNKIMIIAARIEAYSYKEFNEHIFGYKLGKIINFIIFVIVISVTSVMLSGAGAVFQEQLGIPFQVGVISTLVICYLVVLKGLKGIMAINAYIVPIIILFSLFIFISVFDHQPDKLLEMLTFKEVPHQFLWVSSPFTYASFNIITALVVLVPLGKEIKDENVLKWGGFFGGLGLCLMLLLGHFSLATNPETFRFDIPMAEIIKLLGSFIHILFIIVVYGEIFNTVVANVYGISRQLKVSLQIKYHHAVWLILAVIFCISQFGYNQLLTTLYPFYGYLGLVFLIALLLKRKPE
ncbi:YkvI family membrane protein [Ornithinibacillus bavariensis]|uniref:Membrane protein n=1 Tax=Ornithinibacillus bavariensis TaxID=545502 RepID=A0A920C8H3_9BACI|nr:GerAB/ArcD/ProY family transporter [Ornithinibacillus bavariensis]GIO28708.1 membrane protein [Ornithinibacillus bavariensis]